MRGLRSSGSPGFQAAPVLFKGSGFYVTDSRRSSGGGKPESAEKAEKAESPGKAEKAEKAEKTEKTRARRARPQAPAKSESKASEPAA